MISKTYKKR